MIKLICITKVCSYVYLRIMGLDLMICGMMNYQFYGRRVFYEQNKELGKTREEATAQAI